MMRPNPTGVRPGAGLSDSKIEELVEKKVAEALASRALNQPAPKASAEISEAVQRRLEALERKIESGEAEDARAEGLRFLLMAKQHKERGEDTSALKMYELALPFFPGQEKLLKKIDNLRAKIQAKRDEAARGSVAVEVERRKIAIAPIAQLPTATASFEFSQPERETNTTKRKTGADSDDDFNGSAIRGDDYEDDDSFSYKPSRSKKSKSKAVVKSALKIFSDGVDADLGPPTPRTRHLLDIVNSRDVAMIKGLAGLGAKKARDLVEFLEFQSDEDGGNIRTLRQLQGVPGLGIKTVERAYDGITALLA